MADGKPIKRLIDDSQPPLQAVPVQGHDLLTQRDTGTTQPLSDQIDMGGQVGLCIRDVRGTTVITGL